MKSTVMNWKIGIAALASLLTMSSVTRAESSDGAGAHGGGAFLCIDSNAKVIAAESEDLWLWSSARNDLGYVAKPDPNTPGTEQDIAYAAIKGLEPINRHFYFEVRRELEHVFEKREIVPIRLPRTNDPFPESDADCPEGLRSEFRQAAINYDTTGRIVFAQAVFDPMKNVHRAAVSTHEAISRVLRRSYLSPDSKRGQQIVARLYSPEGKLELAPVPKGCTINLASGDCEWDFRIEVVGLDPDSKSAQRVEYFPLSLDSVPFVSGGGAMIAWTFTPNVSTKPETSEKKGKKHEKADRSSKEPAAYLRMGSSVKVSLNAPGTQHAFMVYWNPDIAPIGTKFKLRYFLNEELIGEANQELTESTSKFWKGYAHVFAPRFVGGFSMRNPIGGFCESGVNCD